MPARPKTACPKLIIYILYLIASSAIFLLPNNKLCLFWPEKVLATNLLQNGDFESGIVDPWESSGGSSTATISSELVHSGENALKIQHSKTGSYGFQQTVKDIEGGMFYRSSGYGATKNTDVFSYFLRIAWYESSDGSGSQLSSPVDSNKGERTDGNWVWFELVVQAPLNAHSAKVRTVLNSKLDGVLAHVYFDNISFEESVAPTPTPEPEEEGEEESSSATPTPTSTLTPTIKVTPTPTKKPTPTPTPTPTPPGEILGEEATPTAEVVSFNTTQESTPSSFNLQNSFPFIFIGLGSLFLAIASGSVLLPNLRKKYTMRRNGKIEEII